MNFTKISENQFHAKMAVRSAFDFNFGLNRKLKKLKKNLIRINIAATCVFKNCGFMAIIGNK